MRTYLNVVIDESGSMQPLRKSVIDGFNEWLQEQQKVKEDEGLLTVTLFNTQSRLLYSLTPVANAEPLSEQLYIPNGGTALWDAIADSLTRVSPNEYDGDRVLTVIMTDGQENASVEYNSLFKIKQLIQDKESTGRHTFVFIGSNLDAFGGASGYGSIMGIQAANTLNNAPTPAGMASAFSVLGQSTTQYRGSGMSQSSQFFSQAGDTAEVDAEGNLRKRKA